jgi:hypothetical protein
VLLSLYLPNLVSILCSWVSSLATFALRSTVGSSPSHLALDRAFALTDPATDNPKDKAPLPPPELPTRTWSPPTRKRASEGEPEEPPVTYARKRHSGTAPPPGTQFQNRSWVRPQSTCPASSYENRQPSQPRVLRTSQTPRPPANRETTAFPPLEGIRGMPPVSLPSIPFGPLGGMAPQPPRSLGPPTNWADFQRELSEQSSTVARLTQMSLIDHQLMLSNYQYLMSRQAQTPPEEQPLGREPNPPQPWGTRSGRQVRDKRRNNNNNKGKGKGKQTHSYQSHDTRPGPSGSNRRNPPSGGTMV